MSEFEDNLWLSVVREHGDELARTGRTVHKHRRVPRPQLLAGTTVGLAAMATVAALLLGASTSSPAFAVTRNPDGTVTVNLMQQSGIVGANERLAAMGVRAQILALAKHAPRFVCPGGTMPTITFDPASIPKRQALMITPGQPSSGDAAALKANTGNGNIGSTGSGNTGAGAISGGGNNHVVRMYSGGGKIRMRSGGESNHVVRMYCP
jgi:hypothetical protein